MFFARKTVFSPSFVSFCSQNWVKIHNKRERVNETKLIKERGSKREREIFSKILGVQVLVSLSLPHTHTHTRSFKGLHTHLRQVIAPGTAAPS